MIGFLKEGRLMVQNYIVDKLTLSDLKENGKLIIPQFQRGVVWTKAHRKEFIETVKSGDPFGVVLVYQAIEEENKPYILIDGLQRLSTLKAYMDNPLEFIDENDKFMDEKKINDLFESKYNTLGLQLPNQTKLAKERKSFLKKMISLTKQRANIPNWTEIWPDIANQIGIDKDKFEVASKFGAFYDSFKENLELPNIIIHAIVYTGSKDRLPNVFETLNTTSVSLTKYEVYSSQWPTVKVIINDAELIKKVWSKYENLKKSSSFEVAIDEDIIRNEGMTLFEFCFGFSEIVCDENKEYSFLFSKNKKNTDPTGFELLSLACGLQVNKSDVLWKQEYLGSLSGKQLVELKDALLESIKIVSGALKKWCIDLKGTPIKITSAYQVYYMITTVFNHMYSFSPKEAKLEKVDDLTWINGFKKNAHKWFLLHQLSGFWNQNRQVSDLKNLIETKDGDVDYSKGLSKESWEEVIKAYFASTRESSYSRTIQNETKLFMNYLYRLLIDEDANRAKYFEKQKEDENEIEYDIEHIVPFVKFGSFDEEIPASVPGNLCYLPVKDNRSKRDNTIYEYAKDRPSLTYNNDFLEMINYPSREDLSFINCPYSQFITSYNKMISEREQKMIEQFLSLIIKNQ